MATVDKESANWRLFGGGGLLVGGLIWFIATILTIVASGPVALWLWVIGVVLVAVALFFVAFGETGSNGAVGASVFGKVVLVAFGIGYVLLGIALLLPAVGVAAPSVLGIIAGVLIVIGGLLSAYAIYQRAVARGAARWVIFVPVVIGVVYAITALFGWVSFGDNWLPAVLAATFAVTGLLYLLNRKEIG